MMKVFLVLSCLTFSFNQINGQDICLLRNNFLIDSVGDEKEKIKANLNFIITEDSIIIYPGKSQVHPLLSFKILSKQCNWNSDYSKGNTHFKLLINNKGANEYPLLKLVYIDKKYCFFDLLYENQQRRFFSIYHLPY